MDFHQSKAALCLAFIVLCEEFRSHLHYFRNYFEDLLQCLTHVFLAKAQKAERAFFGPVNVDNVACLSKGMLRKLSACLQRRRLRHYFMWRENLVQHIEVDKLGAFIVCTNTVLDSIHGTVSLVMQGTTEAAV